MKYTKEKPNDSGWYWMKNQLCEEMVVYVEILDRLIYPNTYISPEVVAIPFIDLRDGLEWAGPLPKPETI